MAGIICRISFCRIFALKILCLCDAGTSDILPAEGKISYRISLLESLSEQPSVVREVSYFSLSVNLDMQGKVPVD